MPAGSPPTGAGAAGPPPGIAELGARVQRGGIILAVLLAAIVILMVVGANT